MILESKGVLADYPKRLAGLEECLADKEHTESVIPALQYPHLQSIHY